jgi:hypothetical protein
MKLENYILSNNLEVICSIEKILDPVDLKNYKAPHILGDIFLNL